MKRILSFRSSQSRSAQKASAAAPANGSKAAEVVPEETDKPADPLSTFLEQTRTRYLEAVKEGTAGEWTVVMGNEAGDLDTIASSIAYAWLRSQLTKSTQIVPFQQTRRADFRLREENLYALSLAKIDTSVGSLLCRDDVTTTAPFPSHKFCLVDHNRISDVFTESNPEAQVVAVIDHHDDEGLYKDTANPRVVEVPTGSCTSLVSRLFSQASGVEIPAELATLLMCGILIDTGGLKVGGKAEEADRQSAAWLAPRSTLASSLQPIQGSQINTGPPPPLQDVAAIKDLTNTLQTKKADVSHLSTTDLLKRDYKEYTLTPSWATSENILVGLSSVPVGCTSWIQNDKDFWADCEKWMADRGLAALGILTSFRGEPKKNRFKTSKGKHKREQLWVVNVEGVGAELATRLWKGLEGSKDLKAKRKSFKKLGGKDEGNFTSTKVARLYKQGNVEANRKVTAPLVRTIVEGEGKAVPSNGVES
ncbi:hypothetical protein JAAARDRAFT_59002 [Jaapia argillacea MUCL 33604]|uniref:DHHA2 domain-containing protein n=1 Tax=Jaapia argillacea MUCL 33604 TaxID=933084 RepID=A0A067PPK2_9AGAM|nr:hypothetical protein JAAARDRAFT_59002 [Jaapia argillacea MUCL 33604]